MENNEEGDENSSKAKPEEEHSSEKVYLFIFIYFKNFLNVF